MNKTGDFRRSGNLAPVYLPLQAWVVDPNMIEKPKKILIERIVPPLTITQPIEYVIDVGGIQHRAIDLFSADTTLCKPEQLHTQDDMGTITIWVQHTRSERIAKAKSAKFP